MQIEIIKFIIGTFISLAIIFYLFFRIKTPDKKEIVSNELIWAIFSLVSIISICVMFFNKVFDYDFSILTLSSIISALSLFFWLFIIERFDVFKESLSRILLFFTCAIFFMLIVNLAYMYLGGGIESIFIKALIEEIIKLALLELFLYYENDKITYDGFIDAIILALIVSASFFFIENVLYFTSSFNSSGIAVESNIQLIGRILISDLAHIIFTGITVIGIILAFFNSNLNKAKAELENHSEENNENTIENKSSSFQTSLLTEKKLINYNFDFKYKKFNFLNFIKNFFKINLFIKIISYNDLTKLRLNLSSLSRLEIILQMFIIAVLSHTIFNFIAGINFVLLAIFSSFLAIFYFKAIILFQNILKLERTNII